eukprot:62012_1
MMNDVFVHVRCSNTHCISIVLSTVSVRALDALYFLFYFGSYCPLIMSSDEPPPTSPRLFRQSASDEFLLRWLQQNNFEHLYDTISKSRVSILELSQHNENVIRETAQTSFKLQGDELLHFVRSLIRYNNLQCLMKRTNDITASLDDLEYTKNELRIKHSGDVLYVQQRFKNLITALRERQNVLIEEMNRSVENKSNMLTERIVSLKDYKRKFEQQHDILLATETNENADANVNARQLLKNSISLDQDTFANINKTNIEIANYDHMISQIKRTGVITDEFDAKRSQNNDRKMDDQMNCLCGTQLVLTTVDAAYSNKDAIFCNFCNSKCILPYSSDIYHCPQGDVKLHPGGFDLCQLCGTQCLESRKAEKRRKKEERRRNRMVNKHLANIKQYKQVNRNRQMQYSNSNRLSRHNRSISAMKSSEWEGDVNIKLFHFS